ncbi:ShlB/FhaC/HecB family hemolysin secretion/activation protein [Yersinia vastinensis]|uniref:ShlB/FhaC/HecB family hemolysin secretion/activation protein n=1 Tax=Yersinia vastinensis TaxID=2890318 RepID=UPI001643AF27|nr:ShlB/FhaC/HecB family hemolysin secretion/activation protein [Yersinia vastinensis]
MPRSCYSPSITGLLFSLLVFPLVSHAAELAPLKPRVHQLDQLRALEERLVPSVSDVRLSAPPASLAPLTSPEETPCFTIERIKISAAEMLPRWLPQQRLADQMQGQCLGDKNPNLLMSQLQSHLNNHSYVDSRVLSPQQDLNSAALV